MPQQDNHSLLEDVARAEDVYDLLQHIAWTDTIRPRLRKLVEQYNKAIYNNILGAPLPEGLTSQQVAARVYGIEFIQQLFEGILTRGEKALHELNSKGINLG